MSEDRPISRERYEAPRSLWADLVDIWAEVYGPPVAEMELVAVDARYLAALEAAVLVAADWFMAPITSPAQEAAWQQLQAVLPPPAPADG